MLPLFVTRPGFEPRQSDPETDVLPLYYRAIEKNRDPGETRTLGPLIKSQLLYQLSYEENYSENGAKIERNSFDRFSFEKIVPSPANQKTNIYLYKKSNSDEKAEIN